MRDTGRGLTPSRSRSLFEPFNRFGVESEGIEGTGIGLTIVKALVEGMGGTDRGRAASRGEGTLFEVTLPADAAKRRTRARGRRRTARRRRAERAATRTAASSSTSRTTPSTCCWSRSS